MKELSKYLHSIINGCVEQSIFGVMVGKVTPQWGQTQQ